jgi:predicted GH43/DUF377 family glycosyl hydrolase
MSRFVLTLALLLALSSFALMPWAQAEPQWVKYSGNPVLGTSGWDSSYVLGPRVVYDGGTYRMWFTGGNPSGTVGIGYATSQDGVTWNIRSSPVLTAGPQGAWDSGSVSVGSVLRNGTEFLMYYRGTNPTTYATGAIGLANSTDGVTWTKFPGNPVLTSTTFEADQGYISSPFVIKLELTYNMWYTGRNVTFQKESPYTTILYATSLDGVHWGKWPKPVLTPSIDHNAWDSVAVYSPSVVFNGTEFGLWYSGLNQNLVPQIGFATSPDGATWARDPSNPILSPTGAGAWDSAGVEQPNVLAGGNGALLYYDGLSSSSGGRIGMAQPPPGPVIFPIPEFPYLNLLLTAATCATVLLMRRRKN